MTRAHAVNRLVTVPFWIASIVEALAPGERLATLEQIEVAGSFLTRRLHDLACERLGGRLHCVYGVTEAGCVAIAPFDRLDFEAGEVGRVLPGYDLAAFDEAGRRLPPGEAGALRVRGAACSERYVADPRATAEAFRDGWLVTPDLGSVAADGMVTLAGRLSEQIVVGRERVRPAAVEEALLADDAIVDAAAFGAPDPGGVTRLCAAVVARGPLDTAALEAMIAAKLGVPAAFVMRVEALPRNAAGKVMRATLAAMARDGRLAQA
jgi:acyl-coenzyme A synthetase/AMP-(fatty) acid ligase